MPRTSRRVHRRTSRRSLTANTTERLRLRFRVADPDESEAYEQEDFDDEEAREEERRLALRMEMQFERPQMRSNMAPSVPKPPSGAEADDIVAWEAVTFAIGTPVMFLQSQHGARPGYMRIDRGHPMSGGPPVDPYLRLPVGARGEVVFVVTGSNPQIHVRVVDARTPHGERIDNAIGVDVHVPGFGADNFIEPLVDNWAEVSSYRMAHPRRVTTGVRRTSRRVTPNAWDGWTSKRTKSGHLVFRQTKRSSRR